MSLNILFFSTFGVLTSCWEVKMFDFIEYLLVFLDFSTSQTPGGRSYRGVRFKYPPPSTKFWLLTRGGVFKASEQKSTVIG